MNYEGSSYEGWKEAGGLKYVWQAFILHTSHFKPFLSACGQ